MGIKKLGVFLTALCVTTIGQAANTTYDSATGTVTIPEVVINGKVEFVNVKLKANSDGTFSVLSKEAPPVSTTATTYDATNGTVTIPAVEADGKVEYANVKLGFNSDGTLSVLSTEVPPVSDSLSCSTYVPGTSYCNDGKYPSCVPDLSQAAQVQKGMTYDQVVKIIGCHGVFDSMSSAGVDFYWSDDQYGTPFTRATFKDGKLSYFNYSPS